MPVALQHVPETGATANRSTERQPKAWMLAASRFPASKCSAPSPADTRLLLSRFEAHFNLGFHFDGVAALDRGLITKLRPRHTLTELRAGFEFRDLPFRVDDDFATEPFPPRAPKGARVERSGPQSEERVVYPPRRRLRGRPSPRPRRLSSVPRRAALRRRAGRSRVTRNTGLAGYRFTLAHKSETSASIASKGQAAPGHPDNTLAACLERIAVLALVGIANLVNGLLRIDALGNILASRGSTSTAVLRNRR